MSTSELAECGWCILYEDPDHKMEYFVGAGARRGAEARYEQALTSWNCTLFVDASVALRALDSDNAAGQAAEKLAVDPEKSECGLATSVPAAPEPGLVEELERCSSEIWDSLPDGESGVLEITVSVAKLSSYVDALTDATAALRRPPAQEVQLIGVGGKCNDCGFIYWEHNGHLISCPVCALARRDALLREAARAMYLSKDLRERIERELSAPE